MNETEQLAKKITKKVTAKPPLRIRRGTVVSVSGSTATVTLNGSNVPGVPFYVHVTGLTAGSKVDVLMDGETPTIIGRFS